jgi:hypothetical protein
MGQVLDSFLKKDLFVDEFIIGDFISEEIDVSNVEESYIIQLNFSQEGPDDILGYVALEASVDGVEFVPYDNGTIPFADIDGNFIWDVQNSGAVFVRLNFKVNQGTIKATCLYSGKRRH